MASDSAMICQKYCSQNVGWRKRMSLPGGSRAWLTRHLCNCRQSKTGLTASAWIVTGICEAFSPSRMRNARRAAASPIGSGMSTRPPVAP